MADARQLYDELADDYHLNYANWHEAVPRQGRVLAGLIRAVRDDARTVLDCACGIGTQAIGLALEGFTVTGTDLSPKAVARAEREAAAFGVTASWDVADFRSLAADVPGTFDAVVCCDNSLPHLLDDADLRLALANMYAKTTEGGVLVVGIRDYDAILAERPRFTPPQVVQREGQRSILFQLWDWADDGESYELTMFRHVDEGSGWATAIGTAKYRALRRRELEEVALQAGFGDIEWHFPEQTGHHQPLMTARR